jgi:hypothetical protein
MGFFTSTPKKRKSLQAQINREKKLLAIKKQKEELARLRKQRRGF